MPTFAFPDAPARVAAHLRRIWNAPLPPGLRRDPRFGNRLDARLLSTPCRSTSELLRTL